MSPTELYGPVPDPRNDEADTDAPPDRALGTATREPPAREQGGRFGVGARCAGSRPREATPGRLDRYADRSENVVA